MLELEKTYLLKTIPDGLFDCPSKDLLDIYIPLESDHCYIRIRKNGDTMMIMKKELVNEGDLSSMEESIIHLTLEEFVALSQVPSKRIHKHRYYLPYQGLRIEIDIFQEDLAGLIMADVEFPDEKSKNKFQMPDFCLCEVTQDSSFAGGMLCGKSYENIVEKLNDLGYKKLSMS